MTQSWHKMSFMILFPEHFLCNFSVTIPTCNTWSFVTRIYRAIQTICIKESSLCLCFFWQLYALCHVFLSYFFFNFSCRFKIVNPFLSPVTIFDLCWEALWAIVQRFVLVPYFDHLSIYANPFGRNNCICKIRFKIKISAITICQQLLIRM